MPVLAGLAWWQLRRAERAETAERDDGGGRPVIALAVVPVLLATLLIGARGVAAMRTTSDFLVASRRISPTFNAAAVSGEYLSAASFLGVAAWWSRTASARCGIHAYPTRSSTVIACPGCPSRS